MGRHLGLAEAGWLNRDLLVNTRRKQTGAMCPATRSSQAENGSIPVQAASGAAKRLMSWHLVVTKQSSECPFVMYSHDSEHCCAAGTVAQKVLN